MARQVRYEGIKPEAFDSLKDKLKQMGLHLQGNNGSFSEKGVSGKYTYIPENETLAIEELKVGFPASMMLSADSLQQRMTEMIVQQGGRASA
ncbi:hypothetical protein I2I11_13915 [Pontibacter sp. 172403-2]|uniref:hypothetical protein n=1 Tax=Pontibacter rufus TaxID=2791028 RepID=UPI0018AFF2F3|nr:hypothetical protein [Pontibacter sp. 172403-2]MBF9254396.1 hypothetical protein [Pontibacter sp. 172403-2]